MASPIQAAPVSKTKVWAGRIVSTLVALFLVFDGVIKFTKPASVVEAFAQLGLPMSLSVTLGTLLLSCTAVCDSTYFDSRRDLADRLPGRGRRYPPAHRRSVIQPRLVSNLSRPAAWALLARGPAAGTHSATALTC